MQCKWHKISGELNFLKPSDGYRGLSLLLYLLDTCHAKTLKKKKKLKSLDNLCMSFVGIF